MNEHTEHASVTGNEYKPKTHGVITMLERKEVEYLDKLGKDALFTTGHKLTYNEILKALISLIMEADISAENVANPQQFKDAILKKIRNEK